MNKGKKIPITDLYFGIRLYKMSFSSASERDEIVTYNLFGSSRVLWSVAMWVTGDDKFRQEHDFLSWCFFDVRGRAEYEFLVLPWPSGDEDKAQKVDTYFMYVEPNAALLRQMVDQVSVSSAKKYLAEERKKRRSK